MWTTAGKLQTGTSKWEQWKFRNIENADGVEGMTPEENATNFADFYADLFGNDGENDHSSQWCATMP
jgi:hypothetical protein